MLNDSFATSPFEMDPYAVEEHYLLPSIEKIKTLVKFKRTIGVTHYLRYLKLVNLWHTKILTHTMCVFQHHV